MLGYIIVSCIFMFRNPKAHYSPLPLGVGLGVRPFVPFYFTSTLNVEAGRSSPFTKLALVKGCQP